MMGTNIEEVSPEVLPDVFMASQDFELKNRILLEALKNKIQLTQTSLYVQIEEGVWYTVYYSYFWLECHFTRIVF